MATAPAEGRGRGMLRGRSYDWSADGPETVGPTTGPEKLARRAWRRLVRPVRARSARGESGRGREARRWSGTHGVRAHRSPGMRGAVIGLLGRGRRPEGSVSLPRSRVGSHHRLRGPGKPGVDCARTHHSCPHRPKVRHGKWASLPGWPKPSGLVSQGKRRTDGVSAGHFSSPEPGSAILRWSSPLRSSGSTLSCRRRAARPVEVRRAGRAGASLRGPVPRGRGWRPWPVLWRPPSRGRAGRRGSPGRARDRGASRSTTGRAP